MLPWESHGGGGGRTGQACCFSPSRQWSLISCCGAHQCAASLSTLPSTSFPTLPSTLHVWVDTLYADQDAAFLSRKYMQVKLTTCPTVDFWELLLCHLLSLVVSVPFILTIVTLMLLLLYICNEINGGENDHIYIPICTLFFFFHFFKHVKAFLNFLCHWHIVMIDYLYADLSSFSFPPSHVAKMFSSNNANNYPIQTVLILCLHNVPMLNGIRTFYFLAHRINTTQQLLLFYNFFWMAPLTTMK